VPVIDELGYDLVDLPGVSVEETVFEPLSRNTYPESGPAGGGAASETEAAPETEAADAADAVEADGSGSETSES
jgi:hypothetical protein